MRSRGHDASGRTSCRGRHEAATTQDPDPLTTEGPGLLVSPGPSPYEDKGSVRL